MVSRTMEFKLGKLKNEIWPVDAVCKVFVSGLIDLL